MFDRKGSIRKLRPLVLSVIISFLFPVVSSSQDIPDSYDGVNVAWVRTYDGPISDEDIVTSMKVDVSGNVYVTGWSHGEHNEDYATVKYDTEGNELWEARYNHPYNGGDRALALAVDTSGNVYVTGYAKSALVIGTIKYNEDGSIAWENVHEPPYWDNHGTDIALDSNGNIYVAAFCVTPEAEYRLIKYNRFGNIIWEKSYAPPYIEFPVVAIDNQNNVFIAGASWRNFPSSEYIIIKYDETGNELWRKFYNGSAETIDYINAIVIDESQNIYVTGQSTGITSGFDYATIKYDNDGNQLWVARYNGSGNGEDRANAVAVDNTGNVYVTGTGEGDYVTAKYNSDGIEQWVVSYEGTATGSDEACSIVIDDSSNIYITGRSEGSGTGYDFATIKYDVDGIEQWAIRFDGSGSGSDKANSIGIDGSDNVYVAGMSMGSGTDYDYAVIKYSQQQTGIEEESEANSGTANACVLFGPGENPIHSTGSIGFSIPDMNHVSLELFDLTGRKIAVILDSTVPSGIQQVELPELQPGLHFIRMISGEFNSVKRFMVIE